MHGLSSKFPSDAWIPGLKELCFNFLKNLQKRPGGQYLRFCDDKIETIVEEYHETAHSFKVEIFGDNAEKSYIDHHKIAALYIRSFLVHQPFVLDIPAETQNPELCLCTKLANEYFSLPYMEALFRAWNNDFDGILRMDTMYRDNFIKLLYRYKKDINRLDPAALSNIICLIEQHYFIRRKN